MEDHIRIIRATRPDDQEGRILSREAFLTENPNRWTDLIKSGNAQYIRADGIFLTREEGLRLLKIYIMCRNVKNRVAARMSVEAPEANQRRHSA